MVLDGLWPGLVFCFFSFLLRWPAGPLGPDGLWPGLEVFFLFCWPAPSGARITSQPAYGPNWRNYFFLFWPGQRSGLELFFLFSGPKTAFRITSQPAEWGNY